MPHDSLVWCGFMMIYVLEWLSMIKVGRKSVYKRYFWRLCRCQSIGCRKVAEPIDWLMNYEEKAEFFLCQSIGYSTPIDWFCPISQKQKSVTSYNRLALSAIDWFSLVLPKPLLPCF